jgi:hypothetical protein
MPFYHVVVPKQKEKELQWLKMETFAMKGSEDPLFSL